MRANDFSPDENEFQQEIAPSLLIARQHADPCPDADLLMAARAGVLPEKAGRTIEQHLRQCPLCRQLSEDLSSYEYPGVSPAEDRRIRAAWAPRFLWRNWAVAAGVVLLAALGATFWMTHKPLTESAGAARQPASTIPPASVTPPHTVLAVEQAAIRIPAAAVLTYRGDSSPGGPLLDGLAVALKPYGAGDYAEAARRLESLSVKYPDSAEASFYLGVCRLFLNDSRHAVDALLAARRHTDQRLADSITWYLAVALNHAGRDTDAVREAAGLCGHAGEYQEKACAAVAQLKVR